MVKQEVEQCYWRERIGAFMSGSPDYWWKASISNNLNTIVYDVMEVVQNVIMPEIDKRLSDEGLINCWMNKTFAGTTGIGRFKYLTILLNAKGDFKINQVVETFMEKLKGKPNASVAMEHLKEIGYGK